MKVQRRLCVLLLFELVVGVCTRADRPVTSPTQSRRQKPSEGIRFEHISVEQGLSHAGVNCILKDRQGFMWFGTAKGLNRYDGYAFRVFLENPNDSNSLGGNLIYALLEDRDGFIWIGTVGGGLSRFDPVHETFTRYRHVQGDPRSLSHNQVYALFQDRSGQLWVGTRGGLDRFNVHEKAFWHFDPETEVRGDPIVNQVNTIHERASTPGVLWIGTWGGGLKRFDVATKTFAHYKHDPNNTNTLSYNFIRVIYETPLVPNALWICTDGGGLNRFDIPTESFTWYKNNPLQTSSLSNDVVRSMIQDRSGIIWVGTSGGGLNRFDPTTGTFACYRHDPHETRSLSNNNVIAIFEDGTGMHWLGTREGLNRFPAVKEQILLYQHDPADPNSLSNNFLYSLHEDRAGILWISTSTGLNRFDPATEKFTCYRSDPKNPRSLRNNFVRTIYEDRTGTLWVGNTYGYLHKFDRNKATFTTHTFRNDPKIEATNDILSMLEDSRGRFWVGTVEGLYTFDRSKGTHTPVNIGPLESNGVSLQDVYALYEDRHSAFWIGTRYKGLIRVQAHDTVTFIHDSTNPHTLSSNHIHYIHEDNSGTLWVATEGGGLNRFDREKEQFVAFTTADGLPDNTVYGFLEDNSGLPAGQAGNLWLSTDKGICRFNPRTRKCRNFDTKDGLQGSEFNTGSFCKSQSGLMYFGGVNGLNAFHPDSISENARVSPVFITAFKLFDKQVVTDTALSFLHAAEIPYDERFVSFEFAALDFTDPQQNTYEYKLEGFDMDWIRSGQRRYAAYTNLEPGAYVFKVRGANSDGVWNEEGTSLRLSIRPPYWQTWWFRLLGLLLLAAVLYSWHRSRLTKALELERMRVRIASDLHDDLGSTLTRIAVQSEIIQMSQDPGTIRSASSQIATTSREIIATLGDLVWSIDARNDTIGVMLDRMRDFASDVLSSKQVQVHFEENGFDLEQHVRLDLRQNVYLIFKEAVNNAARHSHATEVAITLVNTADHLSMTVADNGRGLGNGETHAGNGMRNMRMRAERIGGRLRVLNESGVRVILETQPL